MISEDRYYIQHTRGFDRLIAVGALLATAGIILSGPVSFVMVRMLAPQPVWRTPALFVEHYNPIQDLPYYFGFVLAAGMVMVAAGHYLNFWKTSNPQIKFQLMTSFGLSIAFCTLISFNYICQTTFVRALVLNYRETNDTALSIFSMSNPLSLCWTIEMWGYAFLGISTWLSSPYYENQNSVIQNLLIANGVVSLIGAIATIVSVNWLMTLGGLILYLSWNVLIAVAMLLIYFHARKNYKAVIAYV